MSKAATVATVAVAAIGTSSIDVVANSASLRTTASKVWCQQKRVGGQQGWTARKKERNRPEG